MQVVICICSGCVPNQIQPTLSPPCTLVFLKWSELMWTAVIMDKKLFSQFMWKSMFLFCPVVLEQRCEFFPITMHQVITSEGQSFFKRTVSQIYFRSQLHSLVKCERTRCSKRFLLQGVFGVERSHCLSQLEQLGLSSIRSSVHTQIRFSNSLSSSIFLYYFSSCFLRMRHFVSLLGTVACGVHSVLLVGRKVGRWCSHSLSE